MAEFGYAYHHVLGGILCQSCQGIVRLKAASSPINHVKKYHPEINLSKSAKERLSSQLKEGSFNQSRQIDIDVSGIAPLMGIKVEEGFVCQVRDPQSNTLCMAGTTSEGDMDRHLSKHAKILRPNMDTRYHKTSIQRLHLRSTECVVVNPALSIINTCHIPSYEAITQTLLPTLLPPQPLVHEDDKDRTPILKYAGFDLLLADALHNHGPLDLVALGSLPGTYCKEGFLENLTAVGEEWMVDCRTHHKAAGKFVQRMLGGNYPKCVFITI